MANSFLLNIFDNFQIFEEHKYSPFYQSKLETRKEQMILRFPSYQFNRYKKKKKIKVYSILQS